MPAGRPSFNWTPEIESEIIDRILSGEAIEDIVDSVGVSARTFYRRKADDAEFGASIARAQSEAQDAWVDRTERLMLSATSENWQLVQFQCRHIAWIAGKRKPKVYGDKIQQEITGSLDLAGRLSAARERKK